MYSEDVFILNYAIEQAPYRHTHTCTVVYWAWVTIIADVHVGYRDKINDRIFFRLHKVSISSDADPPMHALSRGNTHAQQHMLLVHKHIACTDF